MSATRQQLDVFRDQPGALTETSWKAGRLTYEQWLEAGHALGLVARNAQWWIGDWLQYGFHRFGQKYADAMKVTGLTKSTLLSYGWGAQQIPPERRRAELSWTHHAIVGALTVRKQEKWLNAAVKQNWSTDRLRAEVRAAHPVNSTTDRLPAGKRPGHPPMVATATPLTAYTKKGARGKRRTLLVCPHCSHEIDLGKEIDLD